MFEWSLLVFQSYSVASDINSACQVKKVMALDEEMD